MPLQLDQLTSEELQRPVFLIKTRSSKQVSQSKVSQFVERNKQDLPRTSKNHEQQHREPREEEESHRTEHSKVLTSTSSDSTTSISSFSSTNSQSITHGFNTQVHNGTTNDTSTKKASTPAGQAQGFESFIWTGNASEGQAWHFGAKGWRSHPIGQNRRSLHRWIKLSRHSPSSSAHLAKAPFEDE